MHTTKYYAMYFWFISDNKLNKPEQHSNQIRIYDQSKVINQHYNQR